VHALLASENKPPVFDARSRAAYDQEHVPGAISLPLSELAERLDEVPRDRLAIFYCSGST
jgi:rhodanese-related sulfurtransferase